MPLSFDLLTTTSPSSLLYGSIDGWRHLMTRDGERLLAAAIGRADELRQRLAQAGGLAVTGPELLAAAGVAGFDPLKLCVEVSGLGITGYQAAEWLRAAHRVDVQLGDSRRVVAVISYADGDAEAGRLADALEDLARRRPPADRPADRPALTLPPLPGLDLELVMTPREAFFAPAERVPAGQAPGRIAAEMMSPYPPGVPVIAPGERISEAAVQYLRSGAEAGMLLPDATDPSAGTFRVVR